ncbi:MAG: CRTAC1 family protein, partial [Akkermansiaceae bacterium]|nr:CRTAC1 family protein [Akkermansiaceae bacterium]
MLVSWQWLGWKPFRLSVAFGVALVLCPRVPAEGAFVNVTDEAEIGYLQWTAPAGWVKHVPEVMTGGAAVADFDNDGWVDLLVTRYQSTDTLFRNLGDGTFESVSELAGIEVVAPSNGAAWGDIDNDGDADLYISVAGESGDPLRNLLYVNQGDGTFSEEARLWGADLEVPNWHSGFSVAFGDYNLDGRLDIHTCQWAVTGPGNRSVLLENTGLSGGFIDVTAGAGVEMWDDPEVSEGPEFTTQAFTSRLTDLDLDGWPDLVVAGDFGTSRLFWNEGDGTFVDGTESAQVGGDENGMGLAVGDYDGDGLPDLFFTSIYDGRQPAIPNSGWGVSGNRLYRNLGNRVFEDATDISGVRDGGWGWGAVFFDYDNDGDLDLAMTNGFETDRMETETPFHTDPTKLWRNDGGIFTDVSASVGITDTGKGKGLLVFDYDRDGDLDLFIVNNAGSPVLYRNDTTNHNHWLRVKPRGQYSNRDGIGAVVTIVQGDDSPAQHREISGGSHFLTQSEKVAHFGLGVSSEPVEMVKVRWPSGIEQEFSNVSVDQVLEVVEPESPYEAWLTGNFSESERAAGVVTDRLADPDGDGLNNTLEFGAGLDPKEADGIGPIEILNEAGSGEKLVRYRHRKLPRGIRSWIEKSTNLEDWAPCDEADLKTVGVNKTSDWGVEIVT